jgi:hypothetical protein
MKTKNGVLVLTKKEVEALRIVVIHTLIDLSYSGNGTFNKGDDNNTFDAKEAKRAILGNDVIGFIIDITK